MSGLLHKQYGVSDPLPPTAALPLTRGRIEPEPGSRQAVQPIGRPVILPLVRGRAAVGGRGSLTPYFLSALTNKSAGRVFVPHTQ